MTLTRILSILGLLAVVGTARAESVQAGEYFFDDAAIVEGAGTPFTLTPGIRVSPKETLEVSGLSPGPHVLYTRFQDDSGAWGTAIAQPFVVPAELGFVAVARGEYFFDIDPGLDLANPLATQSIDTLGVVVSATDTADVLSLTQMPHTLSLRVADDFGSFSMMLTQAINTRDADGDTFIDLIDVFPQDAGEWRDTDADGIGNNSDPDIDGDGTANDSDADRDGDGIPDADEQTLRLDPTDHVDGLFDTDRDGLTGFDEFAAGTDPNNPDTDGDGILDGSDPTPGMYAPGLVTQLVPRPLGSQVNDRFGFAVAMDGNLVVVGRPGADGGAGDAIVYRTEGSQLIRDAVISVPEGFTAAAFGTALALDGNRLAVGSPGQVIAKGNLEALRAAVFERLSTGWFLKQSLDSPGTDDDFGRSVDLDGALVAVGAPGDDERGSDAGAVHVYLMDDSDNVVETRMLNPEGLGENARFGKAVAVSRGRLAVGAPGNPIGNALAGSVHLFDRISDNLADLVDRGAMTGSRSDDGDAFGSAVALDGDTLVVGAPGEDEGGSDRGAAYVFDPDSFTERGRITPSAPQDGASFGEAVGTMDGEVAVGAPGGESGGVVFRYDRDLVQMNALTARPGQVGFGSSVAMAEAGFVAGAPSTDNQTGAALVQRSLEVVFRAGFE